MTYQVEQKIGKHIYLYEAEGYWDSKKKQARQKRRYIGKKESATGNIVTPRKSFKPKLVQDYGHLYLVKYLCRKLGLEKSVKSTFRNYGDELLTLAHYLILEGKPLYLEHSWAESCYLPKTMAINSQRLSDLLVDIGKSDRERFSFFNFWAKEQGQQKGVWLDITSISSYSENIDFVEWGHNRDDERLPQINLGILVGSSAELPLLYETYPGSIADVATLRNTVLIAKSFGVDIKTMVMDRGFYSYANLQELERANLSFVIPLPGTVKENKRLLIESKKGLRQLNNFCHQGRVIFYWRTELRLNEMKLTAYIYLDEKRRAAEIERFIKKLNDIESNIEDEHFTKTDDVRTFMESHCPNSSKMYLIKINRDGKASTKQKRNELEERLNRMGKMVLITNDKKLDHEQVLTVYRQKDVLEKMFNIMKNDLKEYRLRVSSRTAMEGKLFIIFLATILYAKILQLMKKSKLIKNLTVNEVLMELKKIRVMTSDSNAPLLTEISKKQRTILQQLNIPIPVIPCY